MSFQQSRLSFWRLITWIRNQDLLRPLLAEVFLKWIYLELTTKETEIIRPRILSPGIKLSQVKLKIWTYLHFHNHFIFEIYFCEFERKPETYFITTWIRDKSFLRFKRRNICGISTRKYTYQICEETRSLIRYTRLIQE